MYLTRSHSEEFVKSVETPVLYLEGEKGLTSFLPNLKGKISFSKAFSPFGHRGALLMSKCVNFGSMCHIRDNAVKHLIVIVKTKPLKSQKRLV